MVAEDIDSGIQDIEADLKQLEAERIKAEKEWTEGQDLDFETSKPSTQEAPKFNPLTGTSTGGKSPKSPRKVKKSKKDYENMSLWDQLYDEIRLAEKELFRNSKGSVFCMIWFLLMMVFLMAIYIMVLEKREEIRHWEDQPDLFGGSPRIRIRFRVPDENGDENPTFFGREHMPSSIAERFFPEDPMMSHLIQQTLQHRAEQQHGMMIRRISMGGGDEEEGPNIVRVIRIQSPEDALHHAFPLLPLQELLAHANVLDNLGQRGEDNLEPETDSGEDKTEEKTDSGVKNSTSETESSAEKSALVLLPDTSNPETKEKLVAEMNKKGFTKIHFHECVDGVDAFVEKEKEKGNTYDHISDLGCLPKVFNPGNGESGSEQQMPTESSGNMFGKFMTTVGSLLTNSSTSEYQAVAAIPGKVLADASSHAGGNMHLAGSTAVAPGVGKTTWRKTLEL